jgi:hypothetical protein
VTDRDPFAGLGKRQEQYLRKALRAHERQEDDGLCTYWSRGAERLAESLVKRGLMERATKVWLDGSTQPAHRLTAKGLEVARVCRLKSTLAGEQESGKGLKWVGI